MYMRTCKTGVWITGAETGVLFSSGRQNFSFTWIFMDWSFDDTYVLQFNL